ncbi:MAG TPA: hypothetical protein VF190_15915 [Rhodothermales bacterium]
MARPYDEEALRYLLTVERERAARANRALLVILVGLKKRAATETRTGRDIGEQIFTALSAGVREVDFIGWYRQARIIGAVLAQGAPGPTNDATHRIVKRIADLLGDRLPASITRNLRVKVLRLSPGRTGHRGNPK